jgi:hypothetical protein
MVAAATHNAVLTKLVTSFHHLMFGPDSFWSREVEMFRSLSRTNSNRIGASTRSLTSAIPNDLAKP